MQGRQQLAFSVAAGGTTAEENPPAFQRVESVRGYAVLLDVRSLVRQRKRRVGNFQHSKRVLKITRLYRAGTAGH